MNSARFNASPLDKLHARSVPPVSNVDCSIQVGIGAETARRTYKRRLAFTPSFVHGSTCRTCLRCIFGIDFDQIHGLVEQHRFNLMPSDIENSAVEPTFLSNAFPRFFDSSRSRSRHVLRSQSLDYDSSEMAAYIGCGFMRPMLPHTGLFCLDGRYTSLSLRPTSRAPVTPGGNPLRMPGFLFKIRHLARQMVGRPIGKHNGNSNATIYPDDTARIGNFSVDLAPNGNGPTKSGFADRGFGEFTDRSSCPTEFYPPNRGKANHSPSFVQSGNLNFSTGKRESVVNSFFLWLWVSTETFKKSLVGIVKIFQGELFRRLADISDKIKLSTQCGQFSRLRDIVEIIPRSLLIISPMLFPLLKGEVPDKAADARVLSKLLRLFWRWPQCVGKTSVHHIKLCAIF